MDSSSGKPLNLPKFLLTKGRSGGGSRNPMAPRDANVVSGMAASEAKKADGGSATPANIKRKQVLKEGAVISSPTDSFLSPCSQKLYKRPAPPAIATANIERFDLSKANTPDLPDDASMAPENVSTQ